MNFSRFIKYSFTILLLGLQAKSARSVDVKDNNRTFGHPLVYRIQSIPQENLLTYQSLLTDKVNRLFITNNQSAFIYDGVNFQRIKTQGNPIICSDGNNRIAIAGKGTLSLLTLNSDNCYTTLELIKPNDGFNNQISALGFDIDSKIYFTTGSKLWLIENSPKLIDSSSQNINIFKTTKGLIFYSNSKGFFSIQDGKFISYSMGKVPSTNYLNVVATSDNIFAISTSFPWLYNINGKANGSFSNLTNHLKTSEKIKKCFSSGSYLFIFTSNNRFLAFNLEGQLIFSMPNLSLFNYNFPVDISTSDGINYFVITSTQVFRFINPSMVQLFNENENLKGSINSSIVAERNIYVATSYGLYVSKPSGFDLIKEGNFEDLCLYRNSLYTTGSDGTYHIEGRKITKVNIDQLPLIKSHFFDKKNPKIITLTDRGVYFTLLVQPSSTKELLTDGGTRFTNFYISNQYLILQGTDSEWYYCNQKSDTLTPRKCNKIDKSSLANSLFYINYDSLSIHNERILKAGKNTSYFLNSNLLSENICLSSFHPDYITISINKIGINPKTVFSLDKIFTINSIYFDKDSTAWIATNQGLIYVLETIQKNTSQKHQVKLFSLIDQHNSTIDTIYFGIANNINSAQTEFKIKQGRSIILALGTEKDGANCNFLYSYKLYSSQGNWSEWSDNPLITLNDLIPGKNIIQIRLRNIYGNISPDLMLTIDIIPSFFRTQFTLIALVILSILIIYTITRWRNYKHALERFTLESIINRRTEELVKEKEKTDNLLERVLPRETATELKETGKVNTQKFNMATVLFSDIQGFTKITDDLNPENLIDQLDKFFLYFDSVVDKYKIEKIKTIGDAYMCAGGIPHKNRTNPVEVVLAALEMIKYMHTIILEHSQSQNIWDLRIGIDTGPVIAGVVGRNKLSYDIWGTTVNTASRMESSGEVGKINISGNTYILVQDYFLCTYRGKMPIKNKGDIEMYFVDGIKPELSHNFDPYKPNAEFLLQLQFLRFGDLEEFILEKLEKGLPKNLYYHNLKHTIDVYTQVELIGRSENVTLEEQLLLQTAALFHDAGHLIDYDTHEEMGVKLAREILPDYQYSERQIEIISELILVTKLPPKPKNLMEAIMCDADLDYLGRVDFIPVSNTLYKELHEHGRIGTIQEWNEMQIKFIEKHQYFTNTARRLRNVNKKSQLENIKKWIEENKL